MLLYSYWKITILNYLDYLLKQIIYFGSDISTGFFIYLVTFIFSSFVYILNRKVRNIIYAGEALCRHSKIQTLLVANVP